MSEQAKHTTGRPDITIQHAPGGRFFVRDEEWRVWDGADWRAFGAAEDYPTYPLALKARRAAIAKAEGR